MPLKLWTEALGVAAKSDAVFTVHEVRVQVYNCYTHAYTNSIDEQNDTCTILIAFYFSLAWYQYANCAE